MRDRTISSADTAECAVCWAIEQCGMLKLVATVKKAASTPSRQLASSSMSSSEPIYDLARGFEESSGTFSARFWADRA